MNIQSLSKHSFSSIRRVTMQRIPHTSIVQFPLARTFASAQRLLSSSPQKDAGAQNSRPGWEGRHGDDHATKRKPLDVQADASNSGMSDKGKEGSQGLSQKDERDSNKRAKEDHPEAPEPVIGMNSERGAKGH